MLRLVISIALVLFVILSGAAAGMRRIGHQQTRGQFPLPSIDGCWDNICHQDLTTIEDVLRENPRITRIRHRPNTTDQIEFTYTPAGNNPIRVVIHLGQYNTYSLTRDATYATNPPLMTLADLLLSLGPPDLVSMPGYDSVLLTYSRRLIFVLIQPSEIAPSGMRLRPGDPVIGLNMMGFETRVGPAYYVPMWDWNGFGLYLH
jgi:hypothetical protein